MSNRQSQSNSFRSALIVDDHPLFCDALSMTLQAVAGIRDISTAATLQDGLDWIRDNDAPDVIVLDLNLPDVNGLDGLIRLHNAVDTPIVIVSSMADNRVISSVIHAGAAGFVPKHSQRDVFRNAFDTLREGRTFVPPGYVLLENKDAKNGDDAVSRLASLTNQQARILQLICEGKLNKQIAYDLSIAETTVKAHVTAIMRKLGVQSRTQAVLIAKETSFGSVLSDRA
ncbi:response regulator transcription factor [Sedimentitalea sp. JM2-8]|uniref:Response regulator transcription factor n=2 Tax=Sedimentitalea xiamensis TaxID=3050037 RepID=A0ABT7FAC4_9RHOB|nr:response regulator transcription factor [Sedimentitalea xiamensis]MDK3072054.1 response regulator transcription factor [Sedimentitalea xiamensis]